MNETRTELGHISNATYGVGGYDDAEFGLSLTFEGKGWGVGTFSGGWSGSPTSGAKWDETEQDEWFAKTARLVIATLKDAKKNDVSKLVGAPVEVTFEGMILKSWRVLTEVL